MANLKHLEVLKRGVTVWNEWRGAEFSVEPDLSGANLELAELNGADLHAVNLSRAHLLWARLIDARLIGANLNEANLSGARLSSARLIGADLSGANLWGADLRKAELSRANLRGAQLNEARLSRARLDGADLSETRLIRADLRGAHLTETDLHRAQIGQTVFGNNDLSSVKRLETVIHRGRSTIGVDTLYKSEGRIPDVFLRGVGLPETFISYLPSLIAQPIEFYSCFVSYSHADKSFARCLHDRLQSLGIRCWLDEHELLPGDKVYTEVDRGIRLWDKVLLCCSKDALTSWWVDNEIKIAFDKEQQLWRERGKEILALIPLNLDDYLFSQWQSGLATEVKARLAADFGGWERNSKLFENQFERLVRALRTDSGGKEPPPPMLL